MPQVEAAVCLSDSLDAFGYLRRLHPLAKVLVVGSSSGGQLAALVSQTVPRGTIDGVVLRCPVTSDAFNGPQYVPERLRNLHTTAWNMEFQTSLLGVMKREIPRDGLERMPLEASRDDLRGQPRHWIQVCTNDMLYSDGMCYAIALEDAGVEVQLNVVVGWPHTFWLVAPHLQEALNPEHAMLEGLRWLRG
jgi:acetyl esterase/lipase